MKSSTEHALIELSRALSSGSVLTDADSTLAYARDESDVELSMPEAVVRVRSSAEVSAVMQAASRHGVPVTPRGAGTGRTGGSVPLRGGIVLAFEQMNQFKGLEKDDLLAVVGPGVITKTVHDTVEAEGLFYPPDPNSAASCQIGGNVAENAGGPRAFKYGVTREYVLGMEAVTADGQILKLGRRTVKGVTGYDLTALLVGSEGTLALVTEVTLRLVVNPPELMTLVVFLPDEVSAGRAVSAIIAKGLEPRCLELLDREALSILRPEAALPIAADCHAMLLMEFDGDADGVDREVSRCNAILEAAGATEILVARQGAERERLWSARRDLSYSFRRLATYKLSEDIVVPRSRIAECLAFCRQLSEQYRLVVPTYGHAGDGNLHVNFLWNDASERERVDDAIEALFRAVIGFGGTLSGEHGIGVLKAPYLPLEQSPEVIALQQRIKDLFDPQGILNPGKIFPPANSARLHRAC